MKKYYSILAALALLLMGAACTPEDNNDPSGSGNNRGPSVTVGADHISAISAVLKGKANLNNSAAADLEVGFQYSTSAGILPSNCSEVYPDETDANYNYTTRITGLQPGTTYYYRSFTRQNGKDEYGATKEFKTKDAESLIETQDPSDLIEGYFERTCEATLNAKLDLTDLEGQLIEYGFYIGTSADEQSYPLECSDISNLSFSTTLNTLYHNTQYWYKAYARFKTSYYNYKQTVYGSIRSFTTAPFSTVVDLGLSVKWGKMNLGAEDPLDSGDYYAWGETETYYNGSFSHWKRGKEKGYDWHSYKWGTVTEIKEGGMTKTNYYLTKYCPDNKAEYWDGEGDPDNKTVLELDDDAAHVNLGGNWRIPTWAEWDELMTKCTWRRTQWIETSPGVSTYISAGVYIVTGPSGERIILPSTSYMEGTSLSSSSGSSHGSGYYWSSSLSTDKPLNANIVFFQIDDDAVKWGLSGRSYGLCIRPVSD